MAESLLVMVRKTIAGVACSQSDHIHRLDFCHYFLRQHSQIRLHFPVDDSQLVLFAGSCMHMDLLHFGCCWWQAGETHKVELSFGAAFWPRMWFIFTNFLRPCFVSGCKTWWRLSFCTIYHYTISDVFRKLGRIQYRSTQDKRGAVWCDIGLINCYDNPHYYWYFWARLLAN